MIFSPTYHPFLSQPYELKLIHLVEAGDGGLDDGHRFVPAECNKNVLRQASDSFGVVSMRLNNLPSCGGSVKPEPKYDGPADGVGYAENSQSLLIFGADHLVGGAKELGLRKNQSTTVRVEVAPSLQELRGIGSFNLPKDEAHAKVSRFSALVFRIVGVWEWVLRSRRTREKAVLNGVRLRHIIPLQMQSRGPIGHPISLRRMWLVLFCRWKHSFLYLAGLAQMFPPSVDAPCCLFVSLEG